MHQNQLGLTGGTSLAKSRFFTHTIVLIVAALVPLFTAFNRIHTDTAYGAGDLGPSLGTLHVTAAANDVILNQAGSIVKMDASTADVPPRRAVMQYTMKAGDTVANVAGQFGLTVDTVRWANNIVDVTALGPGKTIVIPPVNGVLVKLQAGAQLQGLASQYHVDAQAIIDFNFLRDPAHLQVGSMLMLPDGQGPSLDSVTANNIKYRRTGSQPLMESITYLGSVPGVSGKFPFGYCTWWVAQKRYVPWTGNAWQWWYNARLYGFPEGQIPHVGAIMVQGISWASPVGHVAFVETVNLDGSFTVSEMNYGRWGVVDNRTIKGTAGLDLLGFIY
jgi:LysM repeat protein